MVQMIFLGIEDQNIPTCILYTIQLSVAPSLHIMRQLDQLVAYWIHHELLACSVCLTVERYICIQNLYVAY